MRYTLTSTIDIQYGQLRIRATWFGQSGRVVRNKALKVVSSSVNRPWSDLLFRFTTTEQFHKFDAKVRSHTNCICFAVERLGCTETIL